MLRNSAEAEDATQETFLRVHKYFGGLDPTRPVAPWVSSIAYRECLKRLHEVARAPSTVEDIEEPGRFGAGEGDALPTDVAEHGEEAGLLRTSLASLAAQDRAILHLHYWEGLSTSEVSQAVDMPVGTVKIRLFRARNRLRELLEPSFQEVW